MPYGSFFHISLSQHFREELALINVCTFIALFMAKLFSVNNNATVNISNEPSSPPVWLGILSITIQAGNSAAQVKAHGNAPANFPVVPPNIPGKTTAWF